MKASLQAFLKGIIDYAGLFPPADLSLDTSIQNYSKYRKSEDAWMLSRFIIPASRLSELEPYKEVLFGEGEPFAFSVLGKGTETISEYFDHLADVEQEIEQFHRTQGDRVTTDILEIKLPREAVVANDGKLLTEVYEKTTKQFEGSSVLPDEIFVEGVFDTNWEKEISLILEKLSEHNEKFRHSKVRIGFKLRCGGVESHMFPSVEQVAFTLNNVREKNLVLKCTAGLHHPIRHYSDTVQTKMHGFFNVFGGAMLGYAHDLSTDQLEEILSEEDPDHFTFRDTGFRWKEIEVATEEIAELRKVALISFGSCSFDEPREDLEQLGLL